MRPVIKDKEEFKKLCDPIVSYLCKNCDPYTTVHISMDSIEVTTVECGIPIRSIPQTLSDKTD